MTTDGAPLNLGALKALGDLLVTGPRVIKVEAGGLGTRFMDLMHLAQSRFGEGPTQRLTAYLPTPEFSTQEDKLILRQSIWDFRRDIDRLRRHDDILWPEVNVRYVELTRAERTDIHELLSDLEETFSDLKLSRYGLAWDGPEESTGALTHYARHFSISANFYVALDFHDTDSEMFNAKWLKIWQRLIDICDDRPSLVCQEYYALAPEEYAKVLLTASRKGQ